jgi:hypothetical protein
MRQRSPAAAAHARICAFVVIQYAERGFVGAQNAADAIAILRQGRPAAVAI